MSACVCVCVYTRAAVRPKCLENSLLNLEPVCEGLSHGHVARESQPQEKLYSSGAIVPCPWEVRVSLFSPCPSQVQLPVAGLASQQPSCSCLPAKPLGESPGNCRLPPPRLQLLWGREACHAHAGTIWVPGRGPSKPPR